MFSNDYLKLPLKAAFSGLILLHLKSVRLLPFFSNETESGLLKLAISVLKLQPNIDYSEIIQLLVFMAHK